MNSFASRPSLPTSHKHVRSSPSSVNDETIANVQKFKRPRVNEGVLLPGASKITPQKDSIQTPPTIEQIRRNKENVFDMDDIVIPYSAMAPPCIEKLKYKEIETPDEMWFAHNSAPNEQKKGG